MSGRPAYYAGSLPVGKGYPEPYSGPCTMLRKCELCGGTYASSDAYTGSMIPCPDCNRDFHINDYGIAFNPKLWAEMHKVSIDLARRKITLKEYREREADIRERYKESENQRCRPQSAPSVKKRPLFDD